MVKQAKCYMCCPSRLLENRKGPLVGTGVRGDAVYWRGAHGNFVLCNVGRNRSFPKSCGHLIVSAVVIDNVVVIASRCNSWWSPWQWSSVSDLITYSRYIHKLTPASLYTTNCSGSNSAVVTAWVRPFYGREYMGVTGRRVIIGRVSGQQKLKGLYSSVPYQLTLLSRHRRIQRVRFTHRVWSFTTDWYRTIEKGEL